MGIVRALLYDGLAVALAPRSAQQVWLGHRNSSFSRQMSDLSDTTVLDEAIDQGIHNFLVIPIHSSELKLAEI